MFAAVPSVQQQQQQREMKVAEQLLIATPICGLISKLWRLPPTSKARVTLRSDQKRTSYAIPPDVGRLSVGVERLRSGFVKN